MAPNHYGFSEDKFSSFPIKTIQRHSWPSTDPKYEPVSVSHLDENESMAV